MAKDGDWRDEALCRGDEPSRWFPEERNPIHTTAYREELQELRSICESCPFQRECLEAALEHPASIEHGVYAGTTGQQRKKLIKEMLDDEEYE